MRRFAPYKQPKGEPTAYRHNVYLKENRVSGPMGFRVGWTAFAAGLLLVTLFAGCLGGDDEPAPQGGDPSEPEDGTGSVEGRVFTEDLNEVADARISLVADGELLEETRSAEDGRYEILNVEPGEYRIQITAPCCREHVQGIEVVEGETVKVEVQLTLFSSDDLQEPYVEPYEWSGFMACGYVLLVLAGDACSDVDDQSDRTLPFQIEPGLETVTAGLMWGSPGVAGDRLQYGFARDPCEGTTCTTPTDYYAYASGESPVLLRADAGDENGGQSFADIEETKDVQMRVFPEFYNVNVFYQQEFTIHYQLHYHQRAPEEYNPLPDQ